MLKNSCWNLCIGFSVSKCSAEDVKVGERRGERSQSKEQSMYDKQNISASFHTCVIHGFVFRSFDDGPVFVRSRQHTELWR